MKEKVNKLLNNNKHWCLLLICLIIFIIMLINVINNEIVAFDSKIYSTINLIKTNLLTNLFKIITEFGSAEVLIAITVGIIIFLKNKKIATCISLNLVLVATLNQVFKAIIQRARPEGFRLIEETGYSFPSGHSMASMAFYGLIIYFVFKNIKNKKAKIIICTVLSLIILLIGISRIYLGVHYASDVIAGFMLSIVYLVLFINTAVKLIEK